MQWPVLILRDGAARLLRMRPSRRAHMHSILRHAFSMRAPQDEDEHRLRHSSPCQTAHLAPAPALLRPGFASLLHSPVEGWAERRETFGCSAEHPWACT